MKPAFDLLALDLDGTLVDSRERVTPRVREAVAAAAGQGVEVVIATGRCPWGAAEAIDQLGLAVGQVLVNGAVRLDRRDPARAAYHLLPVEVARAAIALIEAAGLPAFVYDDPRRSWDIVVAEPNGYLPGFVGAAARRIRLAAPGAWVDRPVLTVVGAGHKQDMSDLVTALRASLAGRAEVEHAIYPSDGSHAFTVIAAGCSKWAGVRDYAAALGIAPERILAFGDSANDITLLRGAGWGVAMGNAAPAVKAAANEVCASNDQDGVAEALARLLPTPARETA